MVYVTVSCEHIFFGYSVVNVTDSDYFFTIL